jgi:hypothetical protein
MNRPVNQLAELLHLLLTKKDVTTRFIQKDLFILNVTSGISYLRSKGCHIVCDYIHIRNRYGRPVKFGKFNLINKNDAIKIYNQLNKTSNERGNPTKQKSKR